MKYFKSLFSLAVLSSGIVINTVSCWAATDPSEVNIKIYELWVSTNSDCTNMTRIYNEANPSYQNMVNGPTFGQASVPNGTYNCVAWKMSDILSYRPAANEGNDCVQGTLYTRDLFRADSTEPSICPDGATINGTGTMANQIEDKMCIYVSVGGSNDPDAGMEPSNPFTLTNAFVVNGDVNGTMVTDFRGKVIDAGNECDCEAPDFSFR